MQHQEPMKEWKEKTRDEFMESFQGYLENYGKYEVADWWLSRIEEVREEARREGASVRAYDSGLYQTPDPTPSQGGKAGEGKEWEKLLDLDANSPDWNNETFPPLAIEIEYPESRWELDPEKVKNLIRSLLAAERERVEEEFVVRLMSIVSKGAPSEQENVIKYGAEIWDGVHKLIEHYNKDES